MADDATPEPVDIPEDIDESLTLEQLEARHEAATAELDDIVANGDRNLANSRRARALLVYRNKLAALISELKAELPAVVEIVEPKLEASDDEPADTVADEVIVPDTIEGIDDTPAAEGADDEVAAKEAIAAALEAGAAPDADGEGAPETAVEEEVIDPDTLHKGLPMFASLSGEAWAGEDGGNATTIQKLSRKLGNLFNGKVGSTEESYLFQTRNPAFDGLPRVGGSDGTTMSADATAAVMAELADNPDYAEAQEAMQAALEFCGIPQYLTTDYCDIRSDRPVAAALGGRSIPIGTGKFQWHKKLGAADIEGTQAAVWTCDDQEAVKADDQSTWKQCATMPGCDELCTAVPYWLVRCLKITTHDEMTRPERIREVNDVIDAEMARLADGNLLRTFDFYSRYRAFDASVTTLGAAAALPFAIASLMQKLGLNRGRAGSYTAFVNEDIAKTIGMDGFLAGESGDGEARIRDAFRLCGVSTVVFTPDWGCEGPLFEDFADEAPAICTISGTELGAPCAESDFATGGPLEPMNSKATIRLVDLSDYRFGQSGVVDYALRRSPEMMKQNCAEFFGETMEILFKVGNCNPSFRVDVENLCATGNRIDHTGAVPCPLV